MKICIASKERADILITNSFFRNEDIIIFVEPQEVRKYKVFHPDLKIIDIKESNKGVSYVFNFMIDYVFNELKEEKIVLASDDIFSICKRNEEGRYDDIKDPYEVIQDIKKGLDDFVMYTIPESNYLYFVNKNTENKHRYNINNCVIADFFGVNINKLKEADIRYDENLHVAEDVDISARLILENLKICSDQQYCIKTGHRLKGGVSYARKEVSCDADSTMRQVAELLSEKYGSEFIKLTHNKHGDLSSVRIDTALLMKRPELVYKFKTKK